MAADRLPDPAPATSDTLSVDSPWAKAPAMLGGPVSAAVSPAEPPEENESDRMLLMALGRLVGWGVVRYEQNMGGGWFSASEIGTAPVRADEVRRLYAKESEARRGR